MRVCVRVCKHSHTHAGILKQIGGGGVEFGFPNIKTIRQVEDILDDAYGLILLSHSCSLHYLFETQKENKKYFYKRPASNRSGGDSLAH